MEKNLDKELLAKYHLEDKTLQEILEALGEVQLELEQRLEQVEDAARRDVLQKELSDVEAQMELCEEKLASEEEDSKEAIEGEKTRGILPIKEEGAKEDPIFKKFQNSNSNVGKKDSEKPKEKADKAKEQDKRKEDLKAEEKALEKHEEELRRQAKELRKDMQDQKKKAQADSRKQASPDAGAPAASAQAATATRAAAFSQDLAEGIKEYAQGNYKNAFQKINIVANQGDDYGLPVKDRGIAEHLLGKMYEKGQGVAADEARAIYWFEKAAHHQNIDGCLSAGTYHATKTPGSGKEDMNNLKRALKYYQKAVKLGSGDGKSKFIQLCEKRKPKVGRINRLRAAIYCKDMIANETDEYIKKEWSKRAKELLGPCKENSNNGKAPYKNLFSILGVILFFLGCAYWTKGMVTDTLHGPIFEMLPKVSLSYSKIPFGQLVFEYSRLFADSVEIINMGVFGVILMALGNFLSGFCGVYDRYKPVRLLHSIKYYVFAYAVTYCGSYTLLRGLQKNTYDLKEYLVLVAFCFGVIMAARGVADVLRKIFM